MWKWEFTEEVLIFPVYENAQALFLRLDKRLKLFFAMSLKMKGN